MAKAIETVANAPRYERVSDVLERLPVSKSHLYELIWSGEVDSVRVGRAVLIPEGAIERYLARQGSAAKPAADRR